MEIYNVFNVTCCMSMIHVLKRKQLVYIGVKCSKTFNGHCNIWYLYSGFIIKQLFLSTMSLVLKIIS